MDNNAELQNIRQNLQQGFVELQGLNAPAELQVKTSKVFFTYVLHYNYLFRIYKKYLFKITIMVKILKHNLYNKVI